MKGYKIFRVKDDGSLYSLNGREMFCAGDTGSVWEQPESVDIRIDKRGYHFCRYIWDLMMYANVLDSSLVVKEIQVNESDIIVRNRTTLNYVTNRFTMIRTVTRDEIRERISNLDPDVIMYRNRDLQLAAVRQGFWIPALLKTERDDALIAYIIHHRDIHEYVDQLIDHKSKVVRRAMAEHGYGLDTLANDPDPFVRIGVVKAGAYWDYLLHDQDWSVRYAIIHDCCYGAEELKNDPNESVRTEARKVLGVFDYREIGNDI